MKLPFDILSQNYVKPNLYLCETDKKRICQIETISMSGSFKFNAYSELNFSVGRTYTNMVTGETLINPFYDKIEALRLVYLEGFGYFEIQDPEITSDGIKEIKEITAYSLEYRLSQKYLENFKVNTGEVDSLEVVAAGSSPNIEPIRLLHDFNKDLSLLDLALEKIYDWKVVWVDDSLRSMTRQFDISRASIYDFIVQDICEKFNCYAIFDTINNEISIYAESLITKHIGDGSTTRFIVTSAYDEIDTVTINSYKTTKYSYKVELNEATKQKIGYIDFETPPDNGARIEITDGSQKKWRTDVYVTFDNLAQEVNVSYSAEDIKTVLTVKGADDLDIREVNMGLPYIVDISYYYTVDWMGQELYDAYTNYLKNSNLYQTKFIENETKKLEIAGRITYETMRLSLKYSIAENVTSTTVGKYYVKCDTENAGLYYKEVQLPDEYNAEVKEYYMINGTDLNITKTDNLSDAVSKYFESETQRDTSHIKALSDSFLFVEEYSLNHLISDLTSATSTDQKDEFIKKFLTEIFNQFGKMELEKTYLSSYQERISVVPNKESWHYHTLELLIDVIKDEIKKRQDLINGYQEQYSVLDEENAEITNNISMDVFFIQYYRNQGFDLTESIERAKQLLIRLSPFLREDEYTDDHFVETDADTIEILFQTKRELLECGKIELAKLCEPKLAFSMDMANIYALKEFDPIIHQFKLGNLINVAIRDDYVKQARLLAVDINFDDFSDFSCEFGELTSLRTPSSIHADLLANALSAGNSVASGQSYWDKGADLATSTDINIQNGLLSAIKGIYNKDQSILIDESGILLRLVLDNGEFSPYQIKLRHNNILVSTDSFETAQTGIGVFEVNGRELYGVLAKAVLSGYIESSTIVGGTINIGNGAFTVDEFGNVAMKASNNISGYTTNEEHNKLENDLNSKIELNKESITAEVTRSTNQEKELESRITINADSITSEVTRAKNAESSLSSKIEINANAITSKVNSGDFGTLIEQNYNHVKIAWNKNSEYIQFENGAMNIYTSNTHNTNSLLMKQDLNGAWYYRNGTTIGRIGTNHFSDDENYKGLVFDLEPNAGYMCWASKNNSDDDMYNIKLIYHNNDTHANKGLHFLCPTYTNGYLYLTDTEKFIRWSGGGCGFNGSMSWCGKEDNSYINCVEIDGPNKQFTVYSGCDFKVATVCDISMHEGSQFYIGNNADINIWSDIKMHNWHIVDAQLTTSSDARLKTNIQKSEVDALNLINQIEMKEFDWIESGEHENIGMIAQQLQTVMPDLVYEDVDTGKLSIKTDKFIPYLIKSIQELTEYVTGGVSTFASRREWVDTYTDEEKSSFMLANKDIYEDIDNDISRIKTEMELDDSQVLLPSDIKGDYNYE